MPSAPSTVKLAPAVLSPELRAHVPHFAQQGYTFQADATGRLYLYLESMGSDVFVMPHAWRDHRYDRATGAIVTAAELAADSKGSRVENYGLNLESIHDTAAGTLQTNDPNFGPVAREVLSSTAEQCPTVPPAPAPAQTSLILPAAIVVAALLVAAGRRRRP